MGRNAGAIATLALISAVNAGITVDGAPARAEVIDPAPVGSSLGTVMRKGAAVCLSIAHAGLPAHTHVSIVVLERQGTVAAAEVSGAAAPCVGGSGASGYRLRLVSGVLPDDIVAVGVAAAGAEIVRRRGQPSVRLRDRPAPLTLRSCASSDGIHVTAWPGAPLSGTPVWHTYVYLGQDLEPNCTLAETS